MMPIVQWLAPELVLGGRGLKDGSSEMVLWGQRTREGLGICRDRMLGWHHAILKRAAFRLAYGVPLATLGIPKSIHRLP